MENLTMHKVRLSVLWLFAAVAALVSFVLTFMEPGIIQQMMSGVVEGMQIGPEILLLLAIVFLVALVMAFLSVTLKDRVNRWANIIMGIVLLVLTTQDLIGHLAHPSAHTILLMGSNIVVYVLIICYAWKWPKQSHRVRSKYSWRDDLM